jgi:hypothetical protein
LFGGAPVNVQAHQTDIIGPAMADTETIVDTPIRPLWWTKRISLLFISVALLVLMTRLVWGWYASRKLAEIDRRMIALGGLSRIAEYNPTAPLPDARNAAVLIRDAYARIDQSVDCPRSSNAEFDRRRVPPERLWFQFAEKAYVTNSAAVDMLDGLRDRPRADWGVRYGGGGLTFPRHLNQTRRLATEAADSGLLLHFKGHDGEAFRRFESILDLGEAMRGDPSFVSNLVGVGIDHLALDCILTASPAVQLAASEQGEPSVSRAVIERLITRLLDERTVNDAFRRSLLFEMRQAIDVSGVAVPSGWLMRPYANEVVCDHARATQSLLERADAGEWPTDETRRLKRLKEDRAAPPAYPYAPSIWLLASYSMGDHLLYGEGRYRLERRFAAVSLATLLFRHDHMGAFPPTLQALVPQYLPAVPIDLHAPGARPIGYLIDKTPDGAPRPLLYSMAGSPTTRPYPYLTYDWHYDDGTGRSTSQMDNIGQWRDLSRWNDSTPNWREWQDPATQPSSFGTFGEFGEFGPPPEMPPATQPTDKTPATSPAP